MVESFHLPFFSYPMSMAFRPCASLLSCCTRIVSRMPIRCPDCSVDHALCLRIRPLRCENISRLPMRVDVRVSVSDKDLAVVESVHICQSWTCEDISTARVTAIASAMLLVLVLVPMHRGSELLIVSTFSNFASGPGLANTMAHPVEVSSADPSVYFSQPSAREILLSSLGNAR